MGVSRDSFLDRFFYCHCNWFCSCCRVCSIVWFWNWVFIRLFTFVGFATGNGLDVVAERVYIVAAAVLDEGSLWAAVRIATHSLKSIFDQSSFCMSDGSSQPISLKSLIKIKRTGKTLKM